MANFDLELILEDRFIELLSNLITEPVKSWSDTKNADLTPVILVNAIEVLHEPGTRALYNGMRIRVDFAVFTSKRKDFGARKAGELRSKVRELLSSTNLVDQLNQNNDILVYDCGVISIGSANDEEDKYWRKDESVEIIASIKV